MPSSRYLRTKIALGLVGAFFVGVFVFASTDKPTPSFCMTGIEPLDSELARAFIVASLFEDFGREDDGFAEPPPDKRMIAAEVRQYLPSILIKDESVPPMTENLEPMWKFEVRTSFGTRKLSVISTDRCGYIINFESLVGEP